MGPAWLTVGCSLLGDCLTERPPKSVSRQHQKNDSCPLHDMSTGDTYQSWPWSLPPVDISGGPGCPIRGPADVFFFRSHQGGFSQQSPRQTPFGKDSLPNGLKGCIQASADTGCDLSQAHPNHENMKNEKLRIYINLCFTSPQGNPF